MTNAQLQSFREIAAAMHGDVPQTWQWIGPHMSQRMFGISQARAEGLVKAYGGHAEPMPA